jgi:hypothetical protein
MNQSQTLLIMGSILMFSFLTITAHRSVLATTKAQLDSEYIITAAEVAETVLNEVKSRSFDEATIFQEVESVNSFTIRLGPENGETRDNYDDIDDYITNGVTNPALVVTTPRAGDFTVLVSVDYVQPDQLNSVCITPTRTKRIRVTVSALLLKSPLIMTSYSSY